MGKKSYYSEQLAGYRLKRCYDLAPPAAQQYLSAEIDYVLDKIKTGSRVLELGCGYGRVLQECALKAPELVGIDISMSNLLLARSYLRQGRIISLFSNGCQSDWIC